MPLSVVLAGAAALILVFALVLRHYRRQLRALQLDQADAELRASAERRRRRGASGGSAAGAAPPPPIRSLDDAIDELRAHFAEYRVLEAGELLERLREAIADKGGSRATAASRRLDALLAPDGELGALPSRDRECRAALAAFNDDEGWRPVSSPGGTRMARRDTPGMLEVRIETVMANLTPLDAICVLREGGLYDAWFPLVTASSTMQSVAPAEVFLHLDFANPPFGFMDMVLNGWGCDNLREGYFLICVRSVRQRDAPALRFPPKPQERNLRVAIAARIQATINILVDPTAAGSTRCAFQIIQPIPPFVPMWIVEYALTSCMANIFKGMAKVTQAIADGSHASKHVQLFRSAEYRGIRSWFSERLDRYLSELAESKHLAQQ